MSWPPLCRLVCRLQVCGAVHMAKPLPRWPSPGRYLAIRIRPVRRLHFWLYDRLLSRSSRAGRRTAPLQLGRAGRCPRVTVEDSPCLPVLARIWHGRSLGYEPRDAGLRRLARSPARCLAWAVALLASQGADLCLGRFARSRRVSCTKPCTPLSQRRLGLPWNCGACTGQHRGASRRSSACRGGAAMTIELECPDTWTPGQALAMRALLQQALRTGPPVIAAVRPDATPDQLADIYGRLGALIREAGLAA